MPLFNSTSYYGRELSRSDLLPLQALFEASPEYFLAINGRGPKDNEAWNEFDDPPPSHLHFSNRCLIGLFDRDHEMIGVATIIADLCAKGVWHIALFLVATHLHRRKVGSELFGALEAWMNQSGAKWLRLGVVKDYLPAERFWAKHGFRQVRIRPAVDTGGRLNDIRIMIKPLDGADVDDYLARVPRDLPDSNLP